MIRDTRLREWKKFGLVVLSICLLWLVVFPVLERFPNVADHVNHQKAAGIDPSAMFYSELEIAPLIAHHAERLQEAHSGAFWPFSSQATLADKSEK